MSYRSQTAIENDRDFETTFTNAYDEDQTAATLITPTTGKLLAIKGISINTEGATSAGQYVRIYFATSGDTAYIYYPPTSGGNVADNKILVKGAQNEVLSITSNLGGDKNYFVKVNYKEE